MSDIKTVKTVSSGGVVVRDGEKGHEVVLVLSNPKRYWQIPKGMVDEGESLEATALREVREETGVVAEVVAPVDTIDYWFQKKNKDGSRTRFHKIVHFYLMQYVSGELVTDWENLDAQWVQVDEAIERLSFKNAKEVMAKAKVLLEKPPKPAVSEKPIANRFV